MPTQRTTRQIGEGEPGFDRFRKFYKRGGSTDESIAQYAEFIGMVRTISGKPLLRLNADGVESLDEKLLGRAKVLRTVLKMFYRANRRADLVEALPRQRRPAKRNLGLEDVLTPDDVMALVAQAGNLRDRALISVMAATGGRISEILAVRLRDVKQSNGGYQIWFGETKVKSQERFSPKIEGAFKDHLDRWIEAHPDRTNRDAWIFPSTRDLSLPVNDGTVGQLLRSLRAKAGFAKAANPHAFRHARVTWGIVNGEDTTRLSIGIWGKPVSAMMNRYAHFTGLETTIGPPKEISFSDVPALPVPPLLSTQKRVGELMEEIAQLRKEHATMKRGLEIMASKLALDQGIAVGTEMTLKLQNMDAGSKK